MAQVQVSQQVNMNHEQSLYSETSMLYSELSSPETEKLTELHTLRFSEPEFDLKLPSTAESGMQPSHGNEKSIAPAFAQTQVRQRMVAVSKYKTSGVRRCGRLSEF